MWVYGFIGGSNNNINHNKINSSDGMNRRQDKVIDNAFNITKMYSCTNKN